MPIVAVAGTLRVFNLDQPHSDGIGDYQYLVASYEPWVTQSDHLTTAMNW
jgi:hypothetical protein